MSDQPTATTVDDHATGGAVAARLAEAERRLADTERLLRRAERRAEIDRLLLDEGAVDLESARLVAESALDAAEARGESPDAPQAVRALRERKPFLFRPREAHRPHRGDASAVGGLMRPHALAPDPVAQLAEAARASGDRGALLRYLRARRGC